MFFLMIGFIKWNVRGLETQCHSECGHAWGNKHGPNAHDGGRMGRTANERPKSASSTTAKNGRMPFADHFVPACAEALTTTAFGSAASGRSRRGGAFDVISIDRSPREAVQGSAEHFICHISALCARDGFQLRGDGGVIVPEVFRRFGGDGFGIRYRFIGLIRPKRVRRRAKR